MTYDDWKLRSDRDEYPADDRCEDCTPEQACCSAHMSKAEIEWEKGTRRFEELHDEGKL